MTPRRIQGELVEIKYEALHVLYMMISLAADLAYFIVRHVDHSQIRQTVQSAEHIPWQLLQVVPGKDEHLNEQSIIRDVSHEIIKVRTMLIDLPRTCVSLGRCVSGDVSWKPVFVQFTTY
jgi:hypothetical protein